MQRRLCPHFGKIMYDTYAEARDAVEAKSKEPDYIPGLEAFHCDDRHVGCFKYHKGHPPLELKIRRALGRVRRHGPKPKQRKRK